MVKDAWKVSGGYLTLGWPQDTNALEDGCINDEQFIGLCEFDLHLAPEDLLPAAWAGSSEGVLAGIFDCLDRVQHMFTRSDPEVVQDWYVRLDGFVGEVQQRIAQLGLPEHRLLILSDHGFKTFEHKVHLNHWLVGNGYMSLSAPERGAGAQGCQLGRHPGLRRWPEQPVSRTWRIARARARHAGADRTPAGRA